MPATRFLERNKNALAKSRLESAFEIKCHSKITDDYKRNTYDAPCHRVRDRRFYRQSRFSLQHLVRHRRRTTDTSAYLFLNPATGLLYGIGTLLYLYL